MRGAQDLPTLARLLPLAARSFEHRKVICGGSPTHHGRTDDIRRDEALILGDGVIPAEEGLKTFLGPRHIHWATGKLNDRQRCDCCLRVIVVQLSTRKLVEPGRVNNSSHRPCRIGSLYLPFGGILNLIVALLVAEMNRPASSMIPTASLSFLSRRPGSPLLRDEERLRNVGSGMMGRGRPGYRHTYAPAFNLGWDAFGSLRHRPHRARWARIGLAA